MTLTDLRLITGALSVRPRALSYVSRQGTTWYLQKGATKTGKPKYFVAKAEAAGSMSQMPEGFEFSESVNGVVSVRRIVTSGLVAADHGGGCLVS